MCIRQTSGLAREVASYVGYLAPFVYFYPLAAIISYGSYNASSALLNCVFMDGSQG